MRKLSVVLFPLLRQLGVMQLDPEEVGCTFYAEEGARCALPAGEACP